MDFLDENPLSVRLDSALKNGDGGELMFKMRNPIKILKFLLIVVTSIGCGSLENEVNYLQERVGGTNFGSWKNTTLVNRYLAESVAVRINARTNYATYYENGEALSKWKVATARLGYATPKGIFRFHSKQVCPAWNNGRGLSAEPCASDNPLGRKALWFSEGRIYGLHGVNWGAIDSVINDDPRNRDASAGCVRNHPENIEWLFERASVGTPVVVGLWDTDPNVIDCSGRSELCGGEGSNPTDRLLPSTLPTWCSMNVNANDGLANVRTGPSTDAEIVQQLKRQHKVKVILEFDGQQISGSNSWYYVEYTLGGPKSGYLHASLLDCTR